MAPLYQACAVVTVAASANLLLLSSASAQAALAAAWTPAPHARIVAIITYTTAQSGRRDITQSDAIWLLAQSAATTPAGQSDGESIVAAFDSSAAETVEDEVAKAYGLKLVARLTRDSLGKRIVHFRIPDGRLATDVLALLHTDQRVSSAQANFRYQLLEQMPTEISSLKQKPKMRANREMGLAFPQSRGRGKVALKTHDLQHAGSLVITKHTSLRWPTADEPFVNVGMMNK